METLDTRYRPQTVAPPQRPAAATAHSMTKEWLDSGGRPGSRFGKDMRQAPPTANARQGQNHFAGRSPSANRASTTVKSGWDFCRRTATLGLPYLTAKVNRTVAATDPPSATKSSDAYSRRPRFWNSLLLRQRTGTVARARQQCSNRTMVTGDRTPVRGRRNKVSVAQSEEPRTTSHAEYLVNLATSRGNEILAHRAAIYTGTEPPV